MPLPPLRFLLVLLLAAGAAAEDPAAAKKKPGSAFAFLSDPKVKMSIHKAEIKRGIPEPGDPRDKLPPIYEPKILPAAKAGKFLRAAHRVLGVRIGDEARAYPLLFLRIHEVVNDTLGGRPIAPNY